MLNSTLVFFLQVIGETCLLALDALIDCYNNKTFTSPRPLDCRSTSDGQLSQIEIDILGSDSVLVGEQKVISSRRSDEDAIENRTTNTQPGDERLLFALDLLDSSKVPQTL